LRHLIAPNQLDATNESIIVQGTAKSPAIAPGDQGKLHLNLPKKTLADFLAVTISDPNGHELWTYVWPLQQIPNLSSHAPVVASTEYPGTSDEVTELKDKDMIVRIKNGELIEIEHNGKKFSLNDGPRVAATNSVIKKISWSLHDNGWLQCDYPYAASGTNDFFGVTFDYPEGLVKGKRWFGDGPYRVWKNRRQGVTQGLWQNDYNDTITGWHDWIYPEFKGCFADVRWLQLQTAEGDITVVPQNIPFVQVLTPKFPPADLAGHTIASLPECGLGFLDAIPPIGSKFQAANVVSPSGERSLAHGEYSGSISFYFGDLP